MEKLSLLSSRSVEIERYNFSPFHVESSRYLEIDRELMRERNVKKTAGKKIEKFIEWNRREI